MIEDCSSGPRGHQTKKAEEKADTHQREQERQQCEQEQKDDITENDKDKITQHSRDWRFHETVKVPLPE